MNDLFEDPVMPADRKSIRIMTIMNQALGPKSQRAMQDLPIALTPPQPERVLSC